jgi:uncharacterized protein (DUF2062 family)
MSNIEIYLIGSLITSFISVVLFIVALEVDDELDKIKFKEFLGVIFVGLFIGAVWPLAIWSALILIVAVKVANKWRNRIRKIGRADESKDGYI